MSSTRCAPLRPCAPRRGSLHLTRRMCVTSLQVSEKAAAGAARAGEKAKEAKTAAAHKLEEAQHGLDEMHLTDRVSELKHAAAERLWPSRITFAHPPGTFSRSGRSDSDK